MMAQHEIDSKIKDALQKFGFGREAQCPELRIAIAAVLRELTADDVEVRIAAGELIAAFPPAVGEGIDEFHIPGYLVENLRKAITGSDE